MIFNDRQREKPEGVAFGLTIHDSGGLLVIGIIGDLNIVTAPYLIDVAEVAVRQWSRTAILLDMSECINIDAVGMEAFFAIRYKLKTLPIALVIAAPSPPVSLALTHDETNRLIPVVATVDEGIAALREHHTAP